MKKNKITGTDRIGNILQSIEFIEKHTKNFNEEGFLREEVLKRAIFREFEVLGEVAKHLSEELREENKQIPWPKINFFPQQTHS